MFKILVPTDFSPTAETAIKYALELASSMNEVQVNIFHCIETANAGSKLINKIDDILLKEAEDEIKKNSEKYTADLKTGIHIVYDITFGETVKEIIKKTKSHEADLIVMGTNGAGGFGKIFFGSVTSEIVEKTTDCPVITVPKNAKVQSQKNIVYATDLKDLYSESKLVIAFAKMLNANLKVLHVTDDPQEIKKTNPEEKAYELVKIHQYANISFYSEYNLNVLDGIEQFAVRNKADMVAMYSRRKTLFERLFDTSLTKEMAFHTHIPLLALPYDLLLK